MSSSQSRTWEMLTGAMAGSALESVWGGGGGNTCSPRRITETRERQQNKQINICFREFKTHTHTSGVLSFNNSTWIYLFYRAGELPKVQLKTGMQSPTELHPSLCFHL